MTNKLKIGSIAVAVAILIALWVFASTPKNYEDCILANIDQATTQQASSLVSLACRAKFPPPENPFAQFQ